MLGILLSLKEDQIDESYQVATTHRIGSLLFSALHISFHKTFLPELGCGDVLKPSPANKLLPSITYYSKKETIVICRDALGNLPIYFTRTISGDFIFSSNIRTIYQLLSRRSIIEYNNTYIAQYLSGKFHSRPYSTDTLYKDIFVIPPGYSLIIDRNAYRLESNFDFRPERWSSLNRKDEFGEAFLHIFGKRILQDCKSSTSLYSQLSGGLDSSSIVSTIKKLLPEKYVSCIHFLSNEGLSEEDLTIADYSYAQDVINHTSYSLQTARPRKYNFEDIVKINSFLNEPNTMLNPHNALYCLSLVKQFGGDTMFSGQGGDGMVGYGYEYLIKLLQDEEWEVLNDELNNLAKSDWYKLSYNAKELIEVKSWRLIKYIRHYINKGDIISAIRLFISIKRIFNINYIDFASILIKATTSKLTSGKLEDITYNSIDSSSQLLPKYPSSIFNNTNIKGWEDLTQLGNSVDVNVKMPYFDLELHELCKATPLKFQFSQGQGRGILRSAMKNILPERVRMRTNKSSRFSSDFNDTINVIDILYSNSNPNDTIWNYIDDNALKHNLKKLRNRDNISASQAFGLQIKVQHAIQLQAWLNS